jgi:exoribonuclease II|tara:strand:+ start:582 stop:785 length:204 start_codon:yes stop_codon:yes gene_type:complete
MKLELEDKAVQGVVNKILERSEVGLKKYGTNLNREDLTQLDWINHAQEEAMDLCLYLEKIKQGLTIK